MYIDTSVILDIAAIVAAISTIISIIIGVHKAATTLFVSVTLILVDPDGQIIENKHLTTAYEPAE